MSTSSVKACSTARGMSSSTHQHALCGWHGELIHGCSGGCFGGAPKQQTLAESRRCLPTLKARLQGMFMQTSLMMLDTPRVKEHVCSPLMDMPCAFTRTPHAGSQREALSSDRPSEKRIGDVQKSIWSLVAEREGHKVVVADILRFQASRTQDVCRSQKSDFDGSSKIRRRIPSRYV